MDFDEALSTAAQSLNAKGQEGEFMIMHLLNSQLRNVELLSHLASYSELLVAVTGAEGSGKSVIANALAAQREAPEDTLFLTASVMLGMPSILSSIANHWDMPAIHEDGVQSREAIRNEALARAEGGGNLLVIIDQADQLDPDTLNDLAHFALLAPQAVSFALFGLPGYENGFRNSPAQAPVHALAVEPINHDEAAELLTNVYGDGDVCPLGSRELEQAMVQSGALPGKFLAVAGRLIASPNTQVQTRQGGFPLRNILSIAAIATTIVMLIVYQFGVGGEAVLDSSSIDDPVEAASPVTDYNYPEVADPSIIEVEAPALDTVSLDVASVAPSQDGITGEVNLADSSHSKLAPSPLTKVEKVSVESPAILSPVAHAVEKVPEVQVQRTYTADELALLKPSTGYIVQLLGSSSAEGAKAFKGEWQARVTGTLYQYEAVHNDKPWFVVVSGVYASKAEASAAVNALPPKLRSQSPWVRPVTDAQNALR